MPLSLRAVNLFKYIGIKKRGTVSLSAFEVIDYLAQQIIK